jgi:hypothetical protein
MIQGVGMMETLWAEMHGVGGRRREVCRCWDGEDVGGGTKRWGRYGGGHDTIEGGWGAMRMRMRSIGGGVGGGMGRIPLLNMSRAVEGTCLVEYGGAEVELRNRWGRRGGLG